MDRKRFGGWCWWVVIAGVALGFTTGWQGRLQAESMVIAYPAKSFSYFPIIVAWRSGIFKAEGLEPKFAQVKPSIAIAGLLRGDVHYTTALGSTVQAAARGAAVKVLLAIANKPQHVLVVKPEIRSVADLRGKRLAVNGFGETTEYEALAIFKANGIRREEVTLLAILGEAPRVAALKSGGVDASIFSIPYNLEVERLGFKRLVSLADIMDLPLAGIGAAVKWIRDNPDPVRRMVRASLKGIAFTKENKEQAVAVAAEWFEMDRGLARAAYEAVVHTWADNGLVSDASLRVDLQMFKERLQLTQDIPITQVVDWSFAQEVFRQLREAR